MMNEEIQKLIKENNWIKEIDIGSMEICNELKLFRILTKYQKAFSTHSNDLGTPIS